MAMLLRYPVAIALAAAITFALFFLMQALIAMGTGDLQKSDSIKIADIHMPERKMEIIKEQELPPKPAEPDMPPPDFAPPPLDVNTVSTSVNLGPVAARAEVDLGGINMGATDGEYLPIVKVAPVYPSRAMSRGVEGYVIVEFTVTELGTVIDPVIIEAFDTNGNPTTLFNRSALQAVVKFKYKPKVVDGNPVAVRGVRNKLTYNLAE